MLTSSDAKWRCLWHLFIWSLLLTFVSQLLRLQDHISFYIFASLSVITLPGLTAVYSNTSGRKGSGLLRVAYVIMDPVISCVTITPVQLVKHLPNLMNGYFCSQHQDQWNRTADCLSNASVLEDPQQFPTHEHPMIIHTQRAQFVVLQSCLVLPAVLALFMGRRTHKMPVNTHFVVFLYWLLTAIEAMTLLENALIWEGYKHMIFTTIIMVAVVMIIANSYAVITLVSYISPTPTSDTDSKQTKFEFIYKIFIGVTGAFFIEIPFIVARFQMAVADATIYLPGSFYFWFAKDFLFIILTVLMILVHKFGHRLSQIPCKPKLDEEVFFKPEKRDVYIQRVRRVRFKEPLIDHDEPMSSAEQTGSEADEDDKQACDNPNKNLTDTHDVCRADNVTSDVKCAMQSLNSGATTVLVMESEVPNSSKFKKSLHADTGQQIGHLDSDTDHQKLINESCVNCGSNTDSSKDDCKSCDLHTVERTERPPRGKTLNNKESSVQFKGKV